MTRASASSDLVQPAHIGSVGAQHAVPLQRHRQLSALIAFTSGLRHNCAEFAFLMGVAAGALLLGCAAPGEPTARHPTVPVAVGDLMARQSGGDVILTFTLPTRSTDREALPESPSIEIYRSALPPGTTAGRKTAWRMVYTIPSARVDSYVKNGHVEFRDVLTPDDFASSPDALLAYMVRTRVSQARASDDSNFFTLPIYPAPAAPTELGVSVTEAAIHLSWSEPPQPSGASADGYRVYRAEVGPGQESASQDVSQLKLKSPMYLVGGPSSNEFSDTLFEFGKTYAYSVRSISRFGADAVESADSVPVIVTPRDTFPPDAPSGLEAAIVPATPQAPAYVELSWAISSEGDLAGYHVYRSDSENTPGQRITNELLPSPAFRDISVVPGKAYFYSISAVDRAGNESPKSSTVQADIPPSEQ